MEVVAAAGAEAAGEAAGADAGADPGGGLGEPAEGEEEEDERGRGGGVVEVARAMGRVRSMSVVVRVWKSGRERKAAAPDCSTNWRRAAARWAGV